jgi:D-glycero-D-manno-heptose 1,7-bisphosphate phosphatase
MQRRRHQLLPPLPGTALPQRGLFVSRFGAILEPHPGGLPRDMEEARFHARVLELLFRASQAGWNIDVIGNVDEVAHGRVSDAAWERFDAALQAHLKGQGIAIKRSYACLDHPEGKPPHDQDSVFLFPNTGVLYHAAQEDGIDLRESWLVSEDVHELAAAWRAGVRVAALEPVGKRCVTELQVEADIVSRGTAAAIVEILTIAQA